MFVSCSELAKEEEANAVLYRNTFGTQPRRALGPLQNAFDLYLKNPANTNVVLWGDRLLALWEVGEGDKDFDCPSAVTSQQQHSCRSMPVAYAVSVPVVPFQLECSDSVAISLWRQGVSGVKWSLLWSESL